MIKLFIYYEMSKLAKKSRVRSAKAIMHKHYFQSLHEKAPIEA